ncbi:MAG: hypothetical protein Q4C03_06630, partial [bacterium]|nr:hypothetical protein [bacterium]
MKKSPEHLAAMSIQSHAWSAENAAHMLLCSCKPTLAPSARIYFDRLRKNPLVNQAFLDEIEPQIF